MGLELTEKQKAEFKEECAFWKKSLSFSGRSTRAEFWGVHIGSAIGLAISVVVGMAFASECFAAMIVVMVISGVLFSWFDLAVTVRRLHDKNMSGLWILANLIPIIGNIAFLIVLVILMFGDGTIGSNKFGPDPKNRKNIQDEELELRRQELKLRQEELASRK